MHALDHVQLVFEPLNITLSEIGIGYALKTLFQPLVRQLVQVVVKGDLFRRCKVRKMILAEFDVNVAAIGDFERPLDGAGTIVEALIHLVGGFEIKLVGLDLQAIVIADRFAGLHAEQHIVRVEIRPLAVMTIVGRDDGDG